MSIRKHFPSVITSASAARIVCDPVHTVLTLSIMLSIWPGKLAMDTMFIDFQMGKMIAAPSANARSNDIRIHASIFSAYPRFEKESKSNI